MQYNELEIKFEKHWMFIQGKRFRRLFENKEQLLEAVALWKDGATIKRIEKIYSISAFFFNQVRKALGIKPKHGGHQLRGSRLKERAERHQQMLEEFRKGAKIREVAEKFNVSMSTATLTKKRYNKEKIVFQDRDY